MKLNIIGAGHVGQVFGHLLAQKAGWEVQDVMNRSLASGQHAVDFIGSGTAIDNWAALRPAEVTMLSVNDEQIVTCCEQLMAHHLLDNSIVFHCSGALASSALASAHEHGCALASVHPIRSFADPHEVLADFDGTYCGLEGDERALALLQPTMQQIGARCVVIDPAAKTLYHAAAVFACNYLTTLIDVALRTYMAAGISEAQAYELAQPLVHQTLNNIFRLGPAQALSGPVARGDWSTVERHQHAVDAWDPAAGQLYHVLTAHTAHLAARKPRRKF